MKFHRPLIVLTFLMTTCNAQAAFDYQRCVMEFFELLFGPAENRTDNPPRPPAQGTPETRERLFAKGDFVFTKNGSAMLMNRGGRSVVMVSMMLPDANLGPLGDYRQAALKQRFPELKISPSVKGTIKPNNVVWPEYYELELVHPEDRSPADRQKRELELFRALDSDLH